ncbi:unnamed protein product [Camellia sinensis]
MEAVIWISIGACLVRLCWEKGCLNSELWHACAGPLVSLHAVGSRVVYFPQGHSEQVGLVAGLKLPITLDKLYYIVIDFTRYDLWKYVIVDIAI